MEEGKEGGGGGEKGRGEQGKRKAQGDIDMSDHRANEKGEEMILTQEEREGRMKKEE